MTNAKIHKNKKIVVNLDLLDFFDTFHIGRVCGYFEKNENFKSELENQYSILIRANEKKEHQRYMVLLVII